MITCYVSSWQVGFCNLIKRAKDQVNHIWIADATENSTYFLSFDASPCYHLKDAAAHAENWGKTSGLVCIAKFQFDEMVFDISFYFLHPLRLVLLQIIEKLREKVLSIVGSSEG